MTSVPFRFKKFTIHHDKCAMKVGTDGVLLGAWCRVEDVRTALDVGTGCGLIALMISQRNDECTVDAVEIDRSSFLQAYENSRTCIWSKRIDVHHSSFSDYYNFQDRKYDLIVSNPPWFQDSLRNPIPERSAARHSHSLSITDLITGVNKLLEPSGRFSMIMPVPEAEIFIKRALSEGLHCRKVTSVYPNPGKPAKRYLLEFMKEAGEIIRSGITIELERRHKYSDEFKKLTGDFYLDFLY